MAQNPDISAVLAALCTCTIVEPGFDAALIIESQAAANNNGRSSGQGNPPMSYQSSGASAPLNPQLPQNLYQPQNTGTDLSQIKPAKTGSFDVSEAIAKVRGMRAENDRGEYMDLIQRGQSVRLILVTFNVLIECPQKIITPLVETTAEIAHVHAPLELATASKMITIRSAMSDVTYPDVVRIDVNAPSLLPDPCPYLKVAAETKITTLLLPGMSPTRK